tara:strand:- start:1635 stop:2402 length:768 start_codon:yes stop_codon:yes gene_type:complete
MAEYETSVTLHQRYNYAASSEMREELVTQMNGIIDGLYENRYDELYHENAFRQVKGKQITIPVEILPKEMSDYILTMGKGYLCNSGLYFSNVDPAKINLEIDAIWATDSEENDYNPAHSHFGLMSGVFYLKVPVQVSELNEEGAFNFHHALDGFMDVNPLQSIRPKGVVMELPTTGKFIIFPAWLKHSVNPFFGPGIRRAVSFNLICPEAKDWKPTAVKDPLGRRKFDQTLKIDTAGGPDAKIQGNNNLRGLSDA